MPLYLFRCGSCESEEEVIQRMDAANPTCLNCGGDMIKRPTSHAFVFMKGKGGYPSFRRKHLGTAPGTTGVLSSEEKRGGPGSPLPAAKIEGEKWLESIE